MTEQPGGTEATGFADGEQSRITSIEDIAREVRSLKAAVAALVPGSRAESQERVSDRLDRPSTVEEQVRAELARADSERQAAEADQSAKAERESVATRLAKLEERPPAPPARRSTKLLGWGDGR